MLAHTDIIGPPEYHVAVANALAHEASKEPTVRKLAAAIARNMTHVPKQAPAGVAQWVRENILYTQESAGEEHLQGPLTTLTVGTGDCDDLVILWASLLRALGLPAQLAGLQRPGNAGFYHAVGLLNGRLYELSLDHTYGSSRRGIRIRRLPRGHRAYSVDPVAHRGAWMQMGSGVEAVGAGLSQAFALLPPELTQGQDAPQALAVVANTGSVAGTVMSTAGALGASGPVGGALAAVAVVGMLGLSLGMSGRFRRSGAQAGAEFDEAVAAAARVMRPTGPTEWEQYRIGLIEAIPRMVGTYGKRGRGSRRVVIGTYQNYKPRSGARWTWGDPDGWKRGVWEVMRQSGQGNQEADAIMQGHRDAALAMLEQLSRLSVPKRTDAYSLMVQTYLGKDALAKFPRLREQPDPTPVANPLLRYGVPLAGAAALGLALFLR